MSLPEHFVKLRDVVPEAIPALRYFGSENFCGRPIPGYHANEIICTAIVAEKLRRVQDILQRDGYTLVVYDAYRPQKAVDYFMKWSKTDDTVMADKYYPAFKFEKPTIFEKGYVATVSNHNRGSTVDITIVKTSEAEKVKIGCLLELQQRVLVPGSQPQPYMDDGTVDMGTSVDLLGEASHPDAPLALIPQEYRDRRDYLRNLMEAEGFVVSPREWWHYWLKEEEPYQRCESDPASSPTFDFDIGVPPATAVWMVEPFSFYANPVTAQDNKFQPQEHSNSKDTQAINGKDSPGLQELRRVRDQLRQDANLGPNGVVYAEWATHGDGRDPASGAVPGMPDAMFPNNSFSVHCQGHDKVTVVKYPMSPGRRDEIPTALLQCAEKHEEKARVVDLREPFQAEGHYLEGTGAINFSTDGCKAAFVSTSLRAHGTPLSQLASVLSPVPEFYTFTANDPDGNPVYHTNVIGWVGTGICAWWLDGMKFASIEEESRFHKYLAQHYTRVIRLSYDEILAFAGNMLEVRLKGGALGLVMSQSAADGISPATRAMIANHYGLDKCVVLPIPTIEKLGGGSARCLLARCTFPSAEARDAATAAFGV